MRYLLVFGLALLFLTGCQSSYEMEDLYGNWKGETWEMSFSEDGSCRMLSNNNEFPNCTFRTIGNALEIASNGSVILSNLTVKGIENDVLTIEFRKLGESNVEKLNRVK